jgi:hypothetical protein
MKGSLMRLSPFFLVATAMMACGGSDSTSPSGNVAGSYTATQFVTTGSSGQTNQLLAGSTLVINLAGNGTTTGHLHLAAQGGNPVLDFDMTGTWSQTGTTVNFSQTADTFVRNIPFTVVANGSKWALEGTGSFSGTAVQITLSQ